MAENSHLSVLSILYNTVSHRLIKNVMRQTKSKHQFVRLKCTEYVSILLQTHPKAVLDKYFEEI